MNCQEVQLDLSEYLEKSLDAIRMKGVETHLLSCATCRLEADGLRDCIREIAALPLVEPPIGFAQRVMAHAREIEVKPSVWQRLTSSLRVSMPIQAAAVAVIAVMAVFVYQKESQIKNSEPAPTSPMPLSFEPNKSPANTDRATEPSPTVAKNAKRENSKVDAARQAVTEARRKTIPEFPALKDQMPAAPPTSVESAITEVKESAPRRPPIQAQEVATGRENLRPSGDTFGIGPTLGGSLRPGLFVPERALSPITEPSADVEFIVRRRETELRDQSAPADALRRRTEGGIAAAAATAQQSAPSSSPQASSISEVRWFAVPAERYDQFKKELVAEAAIESEKSSDAAEKDFALKSNRELLIKVIILSPADR
jgi:hypothetical protein